MEQDPREVELSEINKRLKSVKHLLKNNLTLDTLDADIACAYEGLGDETDVFIFHDSSTFKGSRHLQSLLKLESALDTRMLFNGERDLQKECVRLLEKKIKLVKELNDNNNLLKRSTPG